MHVPEQPVAGPPGATDAEPDRTRHHGESERVESEWFDSEPFDDAVIPALLRSARMVYSRAIRGRWAGIGLSGMPRNAPFLLGGMGNAGRPASELLESMGGSEAAKHALVEELLRRGLLARDEQAALVLTEHGMVAAVAMGEAIDEVNTELRARTTDAQRSGFLVTLGTLCELHDWTWPARPNRASARPRSVGPDPVG